MQATLTHVSGAVTIKGQRLLHRLPKHLAALPDNSPAAFLINLSEETLLAPQ